MLTTVGTVVVAVIMLSVVGRQLERSLTEPRRNPIEILILVFIAIIATVMGVGAISSVWPMIMKAAGALIRRLSGKDILK
jgi:hypothetical protein